MAMVVRRYNEILYPYIEEACSFVERFKGLMGRKNLEDGEGIFFPNCSSIHCFFMKIPIDVVYLDKDYTVVGIETVKPWKVGHFFKEARHILEVKAGSACGICVGDKLEIRGDSNGKRSG